VILLIAAAGTCTALRQQRSECCAHPALFLALVVLVFEISYFETSRTEHQYDHPSPPMSLHVSRALTVRSGG
jgi:hypothetical protein